MVRSLWPIAAAPLLPRSPRAAAHPRRRSPPAGCAEVITGHPSNNVTDSIYSRMGAQLHQQAAHPLGILKAAIYAYFDAQHPGTFAKFDDLRPVVEAKAVRRRGGLRGGGWTRPAAAARVVEAAGAAAAVLLPEQRRMCLPACPPPPRPPLPLPCPCPSPPEL